MKAVASDKENQDADNLSKPMETVGNDREQVGAQKSLEREKVAKTAETAENNEEEDDVKKLLNDKEVTETIESAENNGEEENAKKPLEGKEVAVAAQTAENNEEEDDLKKLFNGKQVIETVETAENYKEEDDVKKLLNGKQVTETAENNGEEEDAKKSLEGKEVAKTVQTAENNEEQDDAEKSLEGEVTKTVETAVNEEHEGRKPSSEGSQVTKPVNGENKKDAQTEIPIAKRKTGLHLFFMNISRVYKLDDLGSEIARIAVPAALVFVADPIASLIDTAFIGHIGSVELAAVGVSISIFNQASKIAIYPLVSVTTTFVAEAATWVETVKENEDLEKSSNESSSVSEKCFNLLRPNRNRRYIPSVSSSIVFGAILGLFLAILLIFAAKPLLSLMGVKSDSPMLPYAYRYLTVRSLGAPAVLLSLAMQSVFRGFKDTKTSLYATVAGDLSNIVLDAILIVALRKGVTGAAIAHVVSQYLIVLILLFKLVKQVDLIPPSFKSLNLTRFLRSGALSLARVVSVTICTTLASSLATYQGAPSMAAFQICFQVWMTSSVLADGLAVAAQAMLATAFAQGEYRKIKATAARVLQLSIVASILSAALSLSLGFGAGIFTKDTNVVKIVYMGLPFVAATQPLNSLAFVFDGINFGASDYTFAAYSMVAVAAISIPTMIFLSKSHGFLGIWTGLTIYMTLRTMASMLRMAAARGPWTFIRK